MSVFNPNIFNPAAFNAAIVEPDGGQGSGGIFVPIVKEWTSRPPHGTPVRRDGHWSANGLQVAWSFNECAGSSVRSFTPIRNVGCSLYGSPSWSGNGLVFDRNTSKYGLANFPAMSYYTIVSLQTHDGSAEYRNILDQDFGPTYFRGFQYRVSNTGYPQYISFNTVPAAFSITSSVVAPANTPFIMCATAANADRKLYVDGKLVGSITVTGSPQGITSNQQVSLGAFSQTAPRIQPYGGEVQFVGVYSRTLSPSEVSALSLNPWQIFEPEVVWVEVGGSTLAALLGGLANSESVGLANISSSIYLGSLISSSSSATAAAYSEIRLGADMLSEASYNASLSSSILFNASLDSASSLDAILSTAITINSDISGYSILTGELAVVIASLGGYLSSVSSAESYLKSSILFNANINNTSTLSSPLSTAIIFNGNLNSESVSLANISTQKILSAAAAGNSLAISALQTAIKIVEVATGTSLLSGSLATSKPLFGEIDSGANLNAVLTSAIELLTNAIGASIASGKIFEQESYSSSEIVASVIAAINPLLQQILAETQKARKMQTNKAVISEDGLSVNVYDDDNQTIIHTFTISQDKNTRTPTN